MTTEAAAKPMAAYEPNENLEHKMKALMGTETVLLREQIAAVKWPKISSS